MPHEKACGLCREVKPLSAYSVRRKSPDGLSYQCRDCVKAKCAAWRERNPGAFKSWHEDNREHRAEYWQTWYQGNREHRANTHGEWARQNPHIVNARTAKRRAAKLRATPPWADLDAVRAVYAEASRLTLETGIAHQVDHVYPLQGDGVCGLHVPANLQILTRERNLRKSNKMPNEVVR